MNHETKPLPPHSEHARPLTPYVSAVRNFLGEIAHGVDTWSSITHGVEPKPRRRHR